MHDLTRQTLLSKRLPPKVDFHDSAPFKYSGLPQRQREIRRELAEHLLRVEWAKRSDEDQ